MIRGSLAGVVRAGACRRGACCRHAGARPACVRLPAVPAWLPAIYSSWTP